MQRIAAIDYGLKRIGLAISDATKSIALPLEKVAAGKNIADSIRNVRQAFASYEGQIEQFIVGLPLLMNGTRGEMAEEAERFARMLQTTSNIKVECFDERLTSVQAEKALKKATMNRKKRSRIIDSTSATLLLQSYLNRFQNF